MLHAGRPARGGVRTCLREKRRAATGRRVGVRPDGRHGCYPLKIYRSYAVAPILMVGIAK